LATRQASDNKVYEVLHKDNKAHVVKINDCPRAGETQYGYVFFDKSVHTPGPVTRVDKVNLEFLLSYIRSFCKFHLKHRATVACCGLANTKILERFVIITILQVPCIVMVEEVDNSNLYIAVSSPDLNFNITRDLESASQINGDERFYSISMPVEIQVM